MTTVNAYLTFNGNCEEAFEHYKTVFGGEFTYMGRFKDMPPGEDGNTLSAEEGNKIMHVSLPISAETFLLGSDTGGEWSAGYTPGNNMSVSISTDSNEKADQLYAGLSAGGQSTMPMSNTFWGSYFGMLTDRFGINWMISVDAQQQ